MDASWEWRKEIAVRGRADAATKAAAVASAFGGTTLVTLADASSSAASSARALCPALPPSRLRPAARGARPASAAGAQASGNALALASAALYAVYTTIIRSSLPSDEAVSMVGFFGYVGLLNCAFSIPAAFALWAYGQLDCSAVTGSAFSLILLKVRPSCPSAAKLPACPGGGRAALRQRCAQPRC